MVRDMIRKVNFTKEVITEIINKWDPIDLFPFAPSDEYEVEIGLIVELINKSRNQADIAKGIQQVFLQQFSKDVFLKTYDECYAIAGQILESIK